MLHDSGLLPKALKIPENIAFGHDHAILNEPPFASGRTWLRAHFRLGTRGSRSLRFVIRSTISTANVKGKIQFALKRHTELEAKAIRVTVQKDNKVILTKRGASWSVSSTTRTFASTENAHTDRIPRASWALDRDCISRDFLRHDRQGSVVPSR